MTSKSSSVSADKCVCKRQWVKTFARSVPVRCRYNASSFASGDNLLELGPQIIGETAVRGSEPSNTLRLVR